MIRTKAFVFDGKQWNKPFNKEKTFSKKTDIVSIIDEILDSLDTSTFDSFKSKKSDNDMYMKSEFVSYKITQADTSVKIVVVMPGANKDSLSASLTENVLTVNYKLMDVYTQELGDEKNLKIEIPKFDYSDTISANYGDGILVITLTIVEPEKHTVSITFQS